MVHCGDTVVMDIGPIETILPHPISVISWWGIFSTIIARLRLGGAERHSQYGLFLKKSKKYLLILLRYFGYPIVPIATELNGSSWRPILSNFAIELLQQNQRCRT